MSARALCASCLFVIMTLTSCGSAPEDWTSQAVTQASPMAYEPGVFVPLASDRQVVIHCGNSMRPGAEALAAIFQRETGIGVRFNFGGSSQLIAAIELGQQGDLYLPHDPYAAMLEAKGLLDRYVVLGQVEPLLIVAPGNPQGIAGLADLARPGLRVGLTDPRYATAGKLTVAAVTELGIAEAFMANVAMEGRSHNDVALGVLHDHLDAGVVWNFIARHYRGQLEAIPSGVDFPETRVTLCLLTHAENRSEAEAFMAFADSEQARALFARYGYTRGGSR